MFFFKCNLRLALETLYNYIFEKNLDDLFAVFF